MGAIETVGFAAVAVASAVAAPRTAGWTGDTPRGAVAVSEVVIYVLFTAGCAWVTWGFARGRSRAWTPFLLVQAFTLASAWPLVRSDQWGYTLGGAAAGVAALVGGFSAVRVYRR